MFKNFNKTYLGEIASFFKENMNLIPTFQCKGLQNEIQNKSKLNANFHKIRINYYVSLKKLNKKTKKKLKYLMIFDLNCFNCN